MKGNPPPKHFVFRQLITFDSFEVGTERQDVGGRITGEILPSASLEYCEAQPEMDRSAGKGHHFRKK